MKLVISMLALILVVVLAASFANVLGEVFSEYLAELMDFGFGI